MAREQGSRNVNEVTDRQMLKEFIRIHAQAAGESIPPTLWVSIEIGKLELREITVREVECSILEPTVFVETCLTSQVAGSLVLILRRKDVQVFLNELMSVDDLPDPDFVFGDVAMSTTEGLVNQMGHTSAVTTAQLLGDATDLADCRLTLSDGRQSLALVMRETGDSGVLAAIYRIKIKGMAGSEFIEYISTNVVGSLYQKIQARKKAEVKAKREEEETTRQAALLEQSSIVSKGTSLDADQAEGKDDEAGELMNTGGRRTGAGPQRSGPGTGQPGAAGTLHRNQTISGNLRLIVDVPLNVSVGIDETKRWLKDVPDFNNGTVVELNKQADAPIDIVVDGQLVVRGEVVVIDDNFGVRITEIVSIRSTTGGDE